MSDLISRQAAIDEIQRFLGYLDGDMINRIHIALNRLPSVQPERKREKWIEYEQRFILGESLETVQKTVRECSVCTAKIAGMVGVMKFCPNCGADMRGEEE